MTQVTSTHRVTIGADWSVETPHDLDAERVAAALGSYCSCLHLIDVVLPALRRWASQMARIDATPLVRLDGGRWAPRKRFPNCCNSAALRREIRTARDAGVHARSVKHVAASTGADKRLLRPLMKAVQQAHASAGTFAMPVGDAIQAEALVSGDGGLLTLWDAGVHPADVVALHRSLDVGVNPLPIAIYLRLAYRELDVRFARASLRATDDPQLFDVDPVIADLATWIADTQTPFDRQHPSQRRQLLSMGFTRDLARMMSEDSITTEQIVDYARGTGLSEPASGQVLAAWAAAGAAPDVPRMLAAVHAGMRPTYRIGRKSLLRVRAHFAAGEAPDAVDAAIAVAIAGTVSDAVFWLRQGHTDPRVIALLARRTTEQFPNISRKTRQRKADQDAP